MATAAATVATGDLPIDTAAIEAALGRVLNRTALAVGKKYTGKVRDVYETAGQLLLVTTDRLSAFDRLLACVPFKGQVLNLTSAWWFERTVHIIPNHIIATPHPNVTVAHKCAGFKIEFVVRAYLTGSTSTSVWMHYAAGARSYCGHALPDGMLKNQPLPYVMCTPTTKDDVHDRPVSAAEVVGEGWMSAADWEYTQAKALELFAFGQAEAAKRGLILVDTKYEFGKDASGLIRVIDEIHTPDSSRYWLADSYAARLAARQEPENIDKEFLRIWFREHCDPYGDVTLPPAPPALVAELSRRYVLLYQRITGQAFAFPAPGSAHAPDAAAITAAVAPYLTPAPARAVVLSAREADGAVPADVVGALVGAPATPAAAGSAAPERTALAVEHYVVDAARDPLGLVTLVRAVDAEARARGLRTAIVVTAVDRADDVSRLVAAQTQLPVVAVLAAAGAAAAGLSVPAQANLLAAAGTGVLGVVGAASAATAVRRILGV